MSMSTRLFPMLIFLSSFFCLASQSIQYNYMDDQVKIIESTILREDISYMVSVPAESIEKPYLNYPILLVLDAGDHFQGVKTILNYYWGNYVPKMILVGIKSNQNRASYFTSFLNNAGKEMTTSFTRFLVEEFMPYIHHNYPTIDHQTIIGHSHAGLYTLNLALSEHSAFNYYISIDPSLFLMDEKSKKNMLSDMDFKTLHNRSLFIGMGGPLDRDDNKVTPEQVIHSNSPGSLLSRNIIALCNFLGSSTEETFNFGWKYYPEDIHGTVTLPASIDGLKYLFSWYQLESAHIINNPDSNLNEIEKALDVRTIRVKKNIPSGFPIAEEELFEMGCQMYSEMGQSDKAKYFHQLWIKNIPSSPAAVLSYADFLLNNNNPSEAISILSEARKTLKSDAVEQKLKTLKKQ